MFSHSVQKPSAYGIFQLYMTRMMTWFSPNGVGIVHYIYEDDGQYCKSVRNTQPTDDSQGICISEW